VDTFFTEERITINETIINETRFFSFKTSPTQDAIDDSDFSELLTSDLRFRPNGRRTVMGVFAWTNNSGGEPSFDGRSIIRFNELDLLDNNILLDSAFITFFVTPPTSSTIHGPHGENNVNIHVVEQDWNESEVAWETQPPFDANVFIKTDVITTENDSIRENVTSFVQEMITTNNHGFILKNSQEDRPLSSVRFYTSNHEETNKRPYLTLYYHEE